MKKYFLALIFTTFFVLPSLAGLEKIEEWLGKASTTQRDLTKATAAKKPPAFIQSLTRQRDAEHKAARTFARILRNEYEERSPDSFTASGRQTLSDVLTTLGQITEGLNSPENDLRLCAALREYLQVLEHPTSRADVLAPRAAGTSQPAVAAAARDSRPSAHPLPPAPDPFRVIWYVTEIDLPPSDSILRRMRTTGLSTVQVEAYLPREGRKGREWRCTTQFVLSRDAFDISGIRNFNPATDLKILGPTSIFSLVVSESKKLLVVKYAVALPPGVRTTPGDAFLGGLDREGTGILLTTEERGTPDQITFDPKEPEQCTIFSFRKAWAHQSPEPIPPIVAASADPSAGAALRIHRTPFPHIPTSEDVKSAMKIIPWGTTKKCIGDFTKEGIRWEWDQSFVSVGKNSKIPHLDASRFLIEGPFGVKVGEWGHIQVTYMIGGLPEGVFFSPETFNIFLIINSASLDEKDAVNWVVFDPRVPSKCDLIHYTKE